AVADESSTAFARRTKASVASVASRRAIAAGQRAHRAATADAPGSGPGYHHVAPFLAGRESRHGRRTAAAAGVSRGPGAPLDQSATTTEAHSRPGTVAGGLPDILAGGTWSATIVCHAGRAGGPLGPIVAGQRGRVAGRAEGGGLAQRGRCRRRGPLGPDW